MRLGRHQLNRRLPWIALGCLVACSSGELTIRGEGDLGDAGDGAIGESDAAYPDRDGEAEWIDGGERDGGERDGGERDDGERDGGPLDAALPDGSQDASALDAGTDLDGGPRDAGSNSGPLDMCVPRAETCDAADDDCDGRVDEGTSQRCGASDVGRCTHGSRMCSGGSLAACVGAVGPREERCDAVDDDCDGTTDEGLTQRCGSTDVGRCRYGTRSCAGGSFGACAGAVGARAERCDGVDDDCDGTTDEGASRTCGTNVGACRTGTRACRGGSLASCTGQVGPRSEIDDGLDNDCDGSTDEGFPCETSAGQQVRARTNDQRRSRGLSILRCDKGLHRAAQRHADDMCRTGVFSHTSADGQTLEDRLRRARATYARAGENLAMASVTPAAVVSLWMGSPPHRANIVEPRFGRLGVGIANCSARSTTYWVQVFGD